MKVYADHAATTKLDHEAFEAMKPYLLEEYGNASQLYSFARAPRAALKKAREIIATCIGADSPDEIFFTSGGTESDNWAIKGIAYAYPEGYNIITSRIEHHAVLNSCRSCEQDGIEIQYLPVTNKGIILPSALEKIIKTNTLLVSIMLSNNEIGTIEPVQELSEIAHRYGALFHTDAVQSVGHITVDVNRLGIDLLSASAHKFNGPKGIGFLYIRKGTNIRSFINGGAQEKDRRAGTENIAAIVGMAAALKINCDAMKQRAQHVSKLEEHLIKEVNRLGIDYIRNGSEAHVPGNVSLSFKDIDGEMLLHRLDLMGICISTGSACNSKDRELSHVIKAIGTPEEYAYGTIRISLGYENTFEDIELIAESLNAVLLKEKNKSY